MRPDGGACRVLLVGIDEASTAGGSIIGCRVSRTTDRNQAMSLLDDGHDCVVVGDVEGDKREFVDAVRERAPELPVVAVADGDCDPRALLDAGADELVVADAPAELLARRVTDAVDRGRDDAEAILTALHRTGQRLMGATTRDEIADVAVETARDVLGRPASAFQLYDADEEALVPVRWSERARDLVDSPRRYTANHPTVWETYQAGERRYVADVADLPPERLAERENIVRSSVLVPLGEHGILIVSSTEPDDFDAADRRFVGLLGSAVEAALDRLERERTLTDLHEVAADLERAETRGAVYDRVVEAAEQLLAFDHCLLTVERDGVLVPETASSEAVAADASPDSVGENLTGHTYRNGESYLIEDMREHPVANPPPGYVAGLSVPVGDYGVFQAGHEEAGHFDERDRELAELLASHAGEALSRIESRERQRAERASFETLFESVPVPVVHARLESDSPVVRNVNEAFEDRFGYDERTVVGENLNEYVLPPDRQGQGKAIERRIRDGERVERTVTRATADGERQFLLKVLPLERGRVREAIAVYVDVTEHHERQRLLKSLHEAATDIADCETPLSVCERTVEAAENLLSFDYCSLALDEDGVLVPTVTSEDLPPEWVRPMGYDEGLTGEVFTEQKSVVVDDLQEHPVGDPQGPFRSLVSMPLGEHGVFGVVAEAPGEFDDEDLELLEVLMAHATQALDSIEWARDLATERDRFDALLETVPVPVVHARNAAQGPVVLEVNDAFEETFGYDAAVMEGRRLGEFVVPADRGDGTEEGVSAPRDDEPVTERVVRRTVEGERQFRLQLIPIEDGTETLGVYDPIDDGATGRGTVSTETPGNDGSLADGDADGPDDSLADGEANGPDDSPGER